MSPLFKIRWFMIVPMGFCFSLSIKRYNRGLKEKDYQYSGVLLGKFDDLPASPEVLRRSKRSDPLDTQRPLTGGDKDFVVLNGLKTWKERVKSISRKYYFHKPIFPDPKFFPALPADDDVNYSVHIEIARELLNNIACLRKEVQWAVDGKLGTVRSWKNKFDYEKDEDKKDVYERKLCEAENSLADSEIDLQNLDNLVAPIHQQFQTSTINLGLVPSIKCPEITVERKEDCKEETGLKKETKTPEVVDKITKAVDQTTKSADQTTKAVDQTTKAPDQTTKAMDQTTKAMDQTRIAADQITKAVDQTTKAMDQATEAMDQTTKAGDQRAKPYISNSTDNHGYRFLPYLISTMLYAGLKHGAGLHGTLTSVKNIDTSHPEIDQLLSKTRLIQSLANNSSLTVDSFVKHLENELSESRHSGEMAAVVQINDLVKEAIGDIQLLQPKAPRRFTPDVGIVVARDDQLSCNSTMKAAIPGHGHIY